jgi:hypothetical protein
MRENGLVVKQKKTECITDILKELLFSKLSNLSLSITEPEDTLPLSKQHATCPCPEPDKSRPQIKNLPLLTLFQRYDLSTTMSIRLTVYFMISYQLVISVFRFPIRLVVSFVRPSYPIGINNLKNKIPINFATFKITN